MNIIQRIPSAYRKLVHVLECAGHETYFVGGCVRDLLLGLQPHDFDITTSATPDEIAAAFGDSCVDLVGARFGVSLVHWFGETVEVATFRTDGAYSDSRRPDAVKYTKDIKEDVQRRDFTINGLLLKSNGEVIDHVGGLDDLSQGLIRAIGEPHKRINEDPVRILRAIRFAAKFHFSIEYTLSLTMRHFGGHLNKVAPERIAKELSSILTSGAACLGVRLLEKHWLLWFIDPTLALLRTIRQNPKYHPEGDVMAHTLKLLSMLPAGCSLTLALAALLHDIGKPATFKMIDGQPTFHGHEEQSAIIAMGILRKLKFSNEITDVVVSLVAQHMAFRNLPVMKKAKQLRFVRQDNFAELLELHRLDALAGSGNLENYEYAVKLLAETPPEVIRPARLITGDDLIACGLKPGPQFKTLLARIEDAQLEGKIVTKADALEFVTNYIGNQEAE